MNRFKKRLVLTRTGGTIIRIRRRRGTARPRTARPRTALDTAPELPAELAAYATEAAEQPMVTSESTAVEAEPVAQAEAAAQVTEAAAEATVAPARATDTPAQATDTPVQAADAPAQAADAPVELTGAQMTETAAQVTETAAQVTKAAVGPAESPLRAAAAPAEPAPGFPLSEPFRDELEVRGLRTTGLFAVPSDSVIQLVILISSFADQEQTANVWVRRVEDDELRTVFFRSLTVPAGGVQQVTVDGLAGQTIRIDVEVPSDLLVPTAAITQYFLADGAIIVRVYKSPADFVPV